MIKNLLKVRLGKKGIATWIAQLLTALFAIGIIATIYFMMYSRYFDIQVTVDSDEAKRHAINMAQVLMSSRRLVHEDSYDDGSKRYYRGVFNATKLDNSLAVEGDLIDIRTLERKGEELSKEISYPNTATRIVITDLENGDGWIMSFGHPGLENFKELLVCFWQNANWGDIFQPVFGPPVVKIKSPWTKWDAESCYGTYGTKIGVFSQDFPVMIYNGGEMHPGRLFLRVMEL